MLHLVTLTPSTFCIIHFSRISIPHKLDLPSLAVLKASKACMIAKPEAQQHR